MANKKISQLNSRSSLATGDLIPIVSSGVTYKTTAQTMLNFFTGLVAADASLTGNFLALNVTGKSRLLGDVGVSGGLVVTGQLTVSGANFLTNGTGYINKLIGGVSNTANGQFSTVVGGSGNINNGTYGFIGAGRENALQSTTYSAIIGGRDNYINDSTNAFIAGSGNTIDVNGNNSSLFGAASAIYSQNSFSAGRLNSIQVDSDNSFILGSNSDILSPKGVIIGNHVLVDSSGEAIFADGRVVAAREGAGENTLTFHYENGVFVSGSDLSVNGTGYIKKIVGGKNNSAGGANSAILGGSGNTIVSDYNYILGGSSNSIDNSSSYCSILGGQTNLVSVAVEHATVLGGIGNTVYGNRSLCLGQSITISNSGATVLADSRSNAKDDAGTDTLALFYQNGVFVSGGNLNVDGTGYIKKIIGGTSNTSTGIYSVVCGGLDNENNSSASFIGAGETNSSAFSSYSAVLAGFDNSINTGYQSVILGGTENRITNASNSLSFGDTNTISGNYGRILGNYSNVGHLGAMILSDSQNYAKNSPGIDSLSLFFRSGVYVSGSNLRVNGTGYIDKIIGGIGNSITPSMAYSVIAGGRNNSILGNYAAILGGANNGAYGLLSSIVGGTGNLVNSNNSTVIGETTDIESPYTISIGFGGYSEFSDHSFLFGTNLTNTSLYSMVFGYNANVSHSGAAVFGDGRISTKGSLANNTCSFHYQNGVIISGSNLQVQSGVIASGNSVFQNLTVTGNFFSNEPIVKVIKSSKLNFKTTGTNNLYTVPSGYLYLIDTMEVITTDITTVGQAPYVKFGNNSDVDAYQSGIQTLSNSLYGRHIFQNPQDAVAAGIVLNATISVASSATQHSGIILYKGYLLQNS